MARHDLLISQRTTFTTTFSYREADGTTVIPLTGATVKAQIRTKPGSPDLVAEFDVNVIGAEGSVTISLDAAATASLPLAKLEYDILVTFDEDSFILAEGRVKVDGTVTVPA